MFRINAKSPTAIKLIGHPVDAMGEIPMSVAYSSDLKTACVVNGGAKAGVSCFTADHAKGLSPIGTLRPFRAYNQTTPPLGPPLTTSDIEFNPSSTAVLVTVKGARIATPPKQGHIYA